MSRQVIMRMSAAVFLLGGIFAYGTASASVPIFCNAISTLADLSSYGDCIDEDGDMLFQFGGFIGNLPTNTAFNVSETEIGGHDLYDFGIDLPSLNGNYTGGGGFTYTMTSLTPELISSASLDSVVVGSSPVVTKILSDIDGSAFLTLTSTGGVPDPMGGGETSFTGRSVIQVADNLALVQDLSYYQHVDNTFNTHGVPVPGTVSLVGIGLVGLSYWIRRRAVIGQPMPAS